MKPTCPVEGCGRSLYARQGVCEAHYRRRQRGTPFDAPVKAVRVRRDGGCAVTGCRNDRKTGALCAGHWRRKRAGRADWDGPLKVMRPPAKWRSLGTVRIELAERLDRIAKQRGISRSLLVEAVLQRHFAKEMDE